jgi:hypothetical protein
LVHGAACHVVLSLLFCGVFNHLLLLVAAVTHLAIPFLFLREMLQYFALSPASLKQSAIVFLLFRKVL